MQEAKAALKNKEFDQYYEKLLKIFEKEQNWEAISKIQMILGEHYSKNKNIEKALVHYQQAVKTDKINRNWKGISKKQK